MEIEKKMKLLACQSIYWTGMNNNIENHIENCSTCLVFSATTAKGKNNPLGIPRQTPGSCWSRHVHPTQ